MEFHEAANTAERVCCLTNAAHVTVISAARGLGLSDSGNGFRSMQWNLVFPSTRLGPHMITRGGGLQVSFWSLNLIWLRDIDWLALPIRSSKSFAKVPALLSLLFLKTWHITRSREPRYPTAPPESRIQNRQYQLVISYYIVNHYLLAMFLWDFSPLTPSPHSKHC